MSINIEENGINSIHNYVLKGSKGYRETRFYASIINNCDCMSLPKIYNVWLENSPDKYYWVLMKYYNPQPQNSQSGIAMIRSIAEVHAKLVNQEELFEKINWDDSILFPFTSQNKFNQAVKVIPELHSKLQSKWKLSPLGKRIMELGEKGDSWCNNLYSYPKTIVHSDLHPQNFIQIGKGNKGIIIDWAGVSINVPFFDIWRTINYLVENLHYDKQMLYSVYCKAIRPVEEYKFSAQELKALLEKAHIIIRIIRMKKYLEILNKKLCYSPSYRLPSWQSHYQLAERISKEIVDVEINI